MPGGRPNDLRRIIVSLPLPLSPCQTLLEHFHLPFPLAISRSNRRFVYIQRVRPPAPPHKILETLQRHWKHPLLTDVVRMLAIANIVAPRWHYLRSRRYLPWAPQAQLANSLAVIYHLTCAPSNSSVSYCPAVRRYAKLLTGIAFKNWLTQGPIYSRNKRQVFYFKGGWLATMSKKRLNRATPDRRQLFKKRVGPRTEGQNVSRISWEAAAPEKDSFSLGQRWKRIHQKYLL